MIIRNLYGDDDDENVYIFEALGNKGVRITDWDACRDKLGSGKYFKKIAFDFAARLCQSSVPQ